MDLPIATPFAYSSFQIFNIPQDFAKLSPRKSSNNLHLPKMSHNRKALDFITLLFLYATVAWNTTWILSFTHFMNFRLVKHEENMTSFLEIVNKCILQRQQNQMK